MGLLATRASRLCGAPDPGGKREAERMWLLREVHPLSQVFSKHTTIQTSESNYSPIKDRDVAWEGAATQQLSFRRAKEGEGAVSIKCICITSCQHVYHGDSS